MDVALWVAAAFLALAFAGAGFLKVSKSRAELAEQGLTWVEDFSDSQVKAIGGVELLAAIGLVLPPLVGVLPVLAPLAAAGLVLVMIGATVVHARRGEYLPNVLMTLALLAIAAFVAWGRFGPHAF